LQAKTTIFGFQPGAEARDAVRAAARLDSPVDSLVGVFTVFGAVFVACAVELSFEELATLLRLAPRDVFRLPSPVFRFATDAAFDCVPCFVPRPPAVDFRLPFPAVVLWAVIARPPPRRSYRSWR
jgi:hypothetical protein